MAKKKKKAKGLLAGAPPEGWGVPVAATPGTAAPAAPAPNNNAKENWVYGARGSRTWTNKVTGETVTDRGMKSNPGTDASAAGGAAPQQFYDVRTPTGQAGAQYQANLQAATAEAGFNRPQEVTPYGNLNYSFDPATGQFTRTQQLAPWEQAKLQNRTWFDLALGNLAGAESAGGLGLIDRAKQAMGQPFSLEGLPQAPTAINPQDLLPQYQKTQDTIYDYYKRRLDPMFAQERQEFEQGLANRGIPEGSEQYQRLLNDFDKRKSDAYQDAISRATESAGAEQTRLSNIGQQYFDLSTRSRENALQERLGLRAQPLQELSTILGGISGVNQPNFVPFSGVGVQPAPYFQAAGGELERQNALQRQQLAAEAQLGAAEIGANAALEGQALQNQGQLEQLQLGADIRQDSQPSAWEQALPGLLGLGGNILGGWAFGGFKNPFK